MHSGRRLLIFFLFVGAVVISLPVFDISVVSSATEEVSELGKQKKQKEEEVKRLEKSIEEYKEKIKQKRLEAVSLSNQLGIIDNTVVQIELDIEVTKEKLEIIDLEIQTIESAIAEKEEVLLREKAMVAELLRNIHYLSDKSYIEIAASYDSFSDVYNTIQYTKTVEKNLAANMRVIRGIKEDLEQKQAQVQKQQELYTNLSVELEEKKSSLEEQANIKEQLLVQTQSSELTFKTLLSQLRSQYQQIENEITGIEQQIRRRLEEQDKLSRIDDSQGTLLSWPTQSRYITARFHDPDYPYRHVFEHSGVDIRSAQGTPIKATASGYVARAKRCASASCYSFIMIVHTGGISTVYGHMSSIAVQEDQFVTRGDLIGHSGGKPGTVGAGPFVTGPHLHFEVRKNGIPVDPLGYLIRDF